MPVLRVSASGTAASGSRIVLRDHRYLLDLAQVLRAAQGLLQRFCILRAPCDWIYARDPKSRCLGMHGSLSLHALFNELGPEVFELQLTLGDF